MLWNRRHGKGMGQVPRRMEAIRGRVAQIRKNLGNRNGRPLWNRAQKRQAPRLRGTPKSNPAIQQRGKAASRKAKGPGKKRRGKASKGAKAATKKRGGKADKGAKAATKKRSSKAGKGAKAATKKRDGEAGSST